MAMDLANYLNETMLDNSYPQKNGIAWYLENCMTRSEVERMSRQYLSVYYTKYIKPDIKAKYESMEDFMDKVIEDLIT